eukprot:scaffold124289_cov63-Attheya_sp.AAC.1
MNAALLPHHQKHFGQAHGTTFTIPPLSDMFDYTTESNFCKQFRKGEINIDNLPMNDDEKDFLREFAPSKEDLPKISSELTRTQLMKGFRIWMEQTSTSPSG